MSRLTAQSLRVQLVHASAKVYAKGWVANHDGNLTARSGPGRIVATPTAMSKGDVTENDLIVVNDQGEQVSGRLKSFTEMALHLAVYERRKDVQAVIHAHPPYATAMAVAGFGLERPIIAEAVVSLGDRVPLVPFALPKTEAWRAGVADHCERYDALMLQNHGVITWGDSLEQAFLRMELVEHLATITHHSMAFGGPRFLDEAHLAPLLDARRKAGLGPEARGLSAPQPPARPPLNVPRPAAAPLAGAGGIDTERLVAVILEELARLER